MRRGFCHDIVSAIICSTHYDGNGQTGFLTSVVPSHVGPRLPYNSTRQNWMKFLRGATVCRKVSVYITIKTGYTSQRRWRLETANCELIMYLFLTRRVSAYGCLWKIH